MSYVWFFVVGFVLLATAIVDPRRRRELRVVLRAPPSARWRPNTWWGAALLMSARFAWKAVAWLLGAMDAAIVAVDS